MMEMWELEREELIKENQRLQLQVHQLKAQREALREQLSGHTNP
jgi:hypothetical protein